MQSRPAAAKYCFWNRPDRRACVSALNLYRKLESEVAYLVYRMFQFLADCTTRERSRQAWLSRE